jgi:hypothetical protein
MMSVNRYAVRVTGSGFQSVIEMGGTPEGDFTEDLGLIREHIAAGLPLEAIDAEANRASIIIPGPGMAYSVLPWADHLADVARAQEAQRAQQAAQMEAIRRGQGAIVAPRMPPANGGRKGRRG